MSLLSTVVSSRRILPPRVFLYGTHKIGKTTFAVNSGAPIIIQTEEGADSHDAPRFPIAKTYAEIQEYISTLYNDQHAFQTVVLDSIDWLEPLINAEVCKRGQKENIEDFGYGKGYMMALDIWREVFAGFDALRTKGMAILILGHCEVKRFDDPSNNSYDRYQPKLHKLANALVQEWADCIFFAAYKTFVTEKEVGFNKERTRAIGNGERVINTEERPSFIAGNRYRLPPELPLSWDAFVTAMNAGLAVKPAQASATTTGTAA